MYIKRCFIVFIQLLIGLCLPTVLSLVYGMCVYSAYNKVTTYNWRRGLTMATHRKIATFNSTIESWTSYCERLHFYFDANDIVDLGKKCSTLLTVCGPSTYQLLKSLVQPRTPMEKTYDEIVETLKTHFNPKPSPIIQRFKFNMRDCCAGESLANYVAELRALGEYCDFGTTIEDMIRDRLVCGINDHGIQRRRK